jgi:hypothetical protein
VGTYTREEKNEIILQKKLMRKLGSLKSKKVEWRKAHEYEED